MNKTRNPNATCGTCPYWDNAGGNWKHNNIESGYCARNNERYVKSKCSWCGNHPDFWEEEKPKEKLMDCRTVTCEQSREIEADLAKRDAVIARLVEVVKVLLTLKRAPFGVCGQTMGQGAVLLRGTVTEQFIGDAQAALDAAKEITS